MLSTIILRRFRAAALLLFAMNILPLAAQRHPLPVIPLPLRVDTVQGFFTINAQTMVFSDTAFVKQAKLFASWTGFEPTVQTIGGGAQGPDGAATRIRFVLDTGIQHGEGYILNISTDTLLVRARTDTGAFYACQTLRQLMPASLRSGARFSGIPIRCADIYDSPRFEWRGLMLDCSRHFFPLEFVKSVIDQLAAFKLNRFHWHLTDDQGWRPEILKYPKLITVGAWRDRGSDIYGGYFTQDELREVVAYASERFITVIPEIDMPGHTTAAIASYPELGCSQQQIPVSNTWGIHATPLCAGRESTFEFLEGVLTEIAAIFPGPFIHLGGDEVVYDAWKNCSECSKRMLDEGLGNVHELQSWFMHRAAGIVTTLGKQVIGWNEMMIAGAPENAVIQAWHDYAAAELSLRSGHRTIISPWRYTYLDYSQTATPGLKIYTFDPAPPGLLAINPQAVLGVEACLWTESSFTQEIAYGKILPRLAYVAETAWTPFSLHDTASIQERVAVFGGHWFMGTSQFWQDPAISWDDGTALTVASAEFRIPKLLTVSLSSPIRADIPGSSTAIEIYPPTVTEIPLQLPDSTLMELDMSSIPTGIPHILRFPGVRKASNPWAMVLDSLSAEGLAAVEFLRDNTPALPLSVFPTPMHIAQGSGQVSVGFVLDRADRRRITLHDVSGKLLQVLAEREFGKGVNIVRFNAGSLSSGSYMIICAGNGAALQRRLIVIR